MCIIIIVPLDPFIWAIRYLSRAVKRAWSGGAETQEQGPTAKEKGPMLQQEAGRPYEKKRL